jgi:hypothetical protein
LVERCAPSTGKPIKNDVVYRDRRRLDVLHGAVRFLRRLLGKLCRNPEQV